MVDGPPRDRDGDRDEIMTVDEVCAWLKVTRDWVYDEVEARRIPFVRLGRRHLRFRRTELSDYLDARTLSPLVRHQPPRWTQAGDLEPLD